MKGHPDIKIPKHSDNFGVIHGDINYSNFFIKENNELCVFDWDLTERGWYLYDLAMMVWGVTMRDLAGMPISGVKGPGVDTEQYTKWLCEGYGGVNRVHLKEAVRLRRDWFGKICRRAVEEGNIPESMNGFFHWVVDNYNKGLFDKI